MPTLAIDAYEKALSMPGSKPTARVLHSLGVLYEQEKRSMTRSGGTLKLPRSIRTAPAWKDMGELYALAKR
jgi:hypothetical protein